MSKGLLMKENQLWVSDNKGLRLEVLEEIHNQPAVGHLRVEHTLIMTRCHYYWSHMHNTIER